LDFKILLFYDEINHDKRDLQMAFQSAVKDTEEKVSAFISKYLKIIITIILIIIIYTG